MSSKQQTLTVKEASQIFENNDLVTPQKTDNYLRQIVSLDEITQVYVPRNQPIIRLQQFGIIPKAKYTLDVYIEIAYLFAQGNSPEQILQKLHQEYPSLAQAHISQVMVKKALQLTSAVIFPQLVKLVPDDGSWTLMIDGTVRTADDNVLVVVLAIPLLDPADPNPLVRQQFDSQVPVIPLVACFLPSENENDLIQILQALKDLLPSLPKAITSDYSPGFLKTGAKVFPDSRQSGCHYHALENIARILINPSLTQLRKKLSPMIKRLKHWSRKTIFSEKNENLKIFARSLKEILKNRKADFGNNLMRICSQLITFHDWAVANKEFLQRGNNYSSLLKFFTHKVWDEIKALLPQTIFVLSLFEEFRSCLSHNWSLGKTVQEAEDLATKQLQTIVKNWMEQGKNTKNEKQKENLIKAAQRVEELIPLLVPVLGDPQFPRTTSILEGLNSLIKRFMRHWSGTQRIVSSFEWVAPLVAVIKGLDNLDVFQDLLDNLTALDWLKNYEKWQKQNKAYRSQVRFANRIANLDGDELIRMMNNLIIRDIIKDAMNESKDVIIM